MILTVYQQVFVQGDRTRAHITIVDETGVVLERRFANYDAYPLYDIAHEHRDSVLKALHRSFDLEKIVYDCNVQGRIEFTPANRGWDVKRINHPRIGTYPQARIAWCELEPEGMEESEGF